MAQTPADRDRAEWEKRREATREAAAKNPRSPAQAAMSVAKNFTQPTKPGYFTEENMSKTQLLVAQCKRLAGRATVIGNTVFTFDKNGIARIISQANNVYDFNVLLRQNGVVQLDADTLQPLDVTAPDPIVEPVILPPIIVEPVVMPPADPVVVEPVIEPPAAPPVVTVSGQAAETAPVAEVVQVENKASAKAPSAEKDVRRKPATTK